MSNIETIEDIEDIEELKTIPLHILLKFKEMELPVFMWMTIYEQKGIKAVDLFGRIHPNQKLLINFNIIFDKKNTLIFLSYDEKYIYKITPGTSLILIGKDILQVTGDLILNGNEIEPETNEEQLYTIK